MKKLLTTFGLLLTLAATTHAQTPPDAFSYSAVARDANSNPIATTTIGIQISLRQGSPLGTVVYQENHFVNTDQFGLFNLTVGGGSVQSGNISTIDWAAANYYLQVGMDANGGNNFLTMGTTQLLSVPYALYAKSAGSLNGGGAITITSVSSAGDTLYLSNGQTFVSGGSGGGTSGTLATVVTGSATNVTAVSAILDGNVSSSGGELILARGVCIATTSNPTVDDQIVTMGSGTGAFSGQVGGLQSGTTYHIRAYATNTVGTAYGNNMNFTTQAQGVITALSCLTATNSGTLTSGTAASGVSSSVPYTGGNGGTHNGQTVNSTGVTGLTATLSAGSFASGSGTLTYTITGTPNAAGTANFALNIGGQSCTLSRSVGSILNPNLTYGSMTDQQGNTYATIVIGTQEWMAENLRTTTYRNSDPIPNVIDAIEWQGLTTGAWAHYNNDSQYENPYGKLYNWYAVNDPRNVCPVGWHVPTDAEWTVLTDYLGGESVAGGKMKSTGNTLSGTGLWNWSTAIGTNESGFSGLPGGFRYSYGTFGNIGSFGVWWSSSVSNTDAPKHLSLSSAISDAFLDPYVKTAGESVRCLRD